jgi:hypothetical protein
MREKRGQAVYGVVFPLTHPGCCRSQFPR